MQTIRPLKRHAALVQFSKDHHDALLLIWKVREGLKRNIEPERIRDYVLHSFYNESEPHFQAEEELLFSKMPPGEELRRRAEADHAELRELVAQLKASALPETLREFADKLEEHVRFEERELFQRMQESFSPLELSEIGTAMEQRAKECPVWHDAFWTNKG